MFELCCIDKTVSVSHFFDAANFESLSLLDYLYELSGLHE